MLFPHNTKTSIILHHLGTTFASNLEYGSIDGTTMHH